MELKITTQQMLKILQVVSWIIFIGLCVDVGGIVCSAVYTFAINPASTYFWDGVDLSGLYNYDPGYFMVIVLLMTIVAVLKAILFYLIVRASVEKKLSAAQPFSPALRKLLLMASYLALGIGLFAHFGCEHSKWLSTQQVDMPDPESLHLDGADVWLFMAVILFIVTQLVKRGIEMQEENDLTI